MEQNKRLARIILRGKVSEVRKAGADWQVRMELAQDDETGDKVLSPWVPVQPASAGALKIKVKPTMGEGMTMLSPSAWSAPPAGRCVPHSTTSIPRPRATRTW